MNCPHCGANLVGAKRFGCGSYENATERTGTCYERQITSLKSALDAAEEIGDGIIDIACDHINWSTGVGWVNLPVGMIMALDKALAKIRSVNHTASAVKEEGRG